MNTNITKLEYQDKEIILLATAHVSKESVELVKQVIADERPDSVCIELDEDRFENIQNPKAWENTDIVKVIKSKRVGFLLANLILSAFQKKIAKKLGVAVGGEMIQGIESAKEIGAELVLADRKIQTTFLRIWRKLNLWEKFKLVFSLVFVFDSDEKESEISETDLQNLLQTDILESALADMGQYFPKIKDILLSERDQYLASKIKKAPGKKIVAVLGGAHVPGVKEEIYRTQDVQALSTVPPKKHLSKAVVWAIPVALLALLVYAFSVSFQTGLTQLSTYILWSGTLAALCTALSLGHPLSIATSFVAAPFTTFIPFLACGWFTGLVEASIKKPTVKDINSISEDIFSFKGFYKNRVLRIILIVIMANIGSSIGTFIGGAGIIGNLF